MKSKLKIVALLSMPVFVVSQPQQIQLESLHLAMQNVANDTIRMDAYLKLGVFYDDVNLDSSVYYGEKGIAIARRLQLRLKEAEMLTNISFPLTKMGNYPQSLKVLKQALEITEDSSNEKKPWHLSKGQAPRTYRLSLLGYTHLGFGWLYFFTGNNEKQINAYIESIRLAESIKDTLLLALTYGDMGDAYSNLNKLDSALSFEQKALDYFSAIPFDERKFEGDVFSGIGRIYQQMGKLDLARENFARAIQVSVMQNNSTHAGNACLQLANLYQTIKIPDSSLLYYKKAVEAYKSVGNERNNVFAYRMISQYYLEKKNKDSSFTYLRLAALLYDSLEGIEKKKLQEYQVMAFNEQLRMQELEKEKIQTQNNIRTYAMVAGLAVFLTIGLILYRNYQQKNKANKVLEATLTNLRATQSMLIQSEKMASLGELTAGIAHEIQNPLNFVNNFSEVNKELIEELQQEMDKGNLADARAISIDLKQNEEKISHHGKRADSIVKGMLQHSRTTTGQKESTNINALADEYLRLSYHGMRAKDKTFNAEIKTDFDPAIGKINIVPQDIGRALLNLINNALYTVVQRKKEVGDGFEPIVRVSTKRTNDGIEIRVTDNGNGIPEKIRDKIFQPFFTTKPTGQGTGLGLSLAYDVITKGHGGQLNVETTNGEGTTFTITLKNNSS
jgi:two-component system, NtrC family, sensor kinase